MSVKSNLPQVAALRNRVEERFGAPLRVHADFVALVAEIEMLLRQHISESTLERVWGYSTRGYETISLRTLNVLSQYGAECHWEAFCRLLQEEDDEESVLFDTTTILSSDLDCGDRLLIGWRPNRLCTIRHLGDGEFEAEQCENAKMRSGDRFSCERFMLGHPLTLNNFRQTPTDVDGQCYRVGSRHGLTTLKRLK